MSSLPVMRVGSRRSRTVSSAIRQRWSASSRLSQSPIWRRFAEEFSPELSRQVTPPFGLANMLAQATSINIDTIAPRVRTTFATTRVQLLVDDVGHEHVRAARIGGFRIIGANRWETPASLGTLDTQLRVGTRTQSSRGVLTAS